jgi:uncharacterized membrane protein
MGSLFPGGIISMLMWALIILTLIYLAIRLFRALTSEPIKQDRDRFDSLEIIKMRYARGEIGQEDYLTMKETLKQSG